ncbi:MAG: hypothetical protein JW896_10030 [Deltaproteobacteria bacterium]|nr:hypothetical protein [Deltaproteobacteria bacterium]
MRVKSECLFSVVCAELFIQNNGLRAAPVYKSIRDLLFLCIALVFSLPLSSGTWASEQQDIQSYENLDARWEPWIGSWRLVSNTINTVGTVLKEEYLLTIRPDEKGKFVTMESSRDKTVMFEEKIEADGVRHPLDKDGCTGWYSYSWSKNGKRLLFKGESSCSENLSQSISGILIIDTIGDCVDIKLLKSGEEKAITIRRYRSLENGLVAPAPKMPTKAFVARMSAGSKFSIDEVIELSGKVEPEVLEAALVEMHGSFPVNSKQLVRLSDAKVPSQIVDLVVALSFPEKFTVERAALSWVKTASDLYAPYYHWPMSPWYWTSSVYPLYGYQYWGWDWYQQYGWYYYPYSYIYYSPHGGGSGIDSTDSSGRLVAGQGYTRVYPGDSVPQRRYAHPRNAHATKETAVSSSAPSGGTSSGASSGAPAGAGAYSAPSASPDGYSSGGYSTGSAQPH